MAFVKVGQLLQHHRHIFRGSNNVVDAMAIVSAWKPILDDIDCVEKFNRTKALSFSNGKLVVQAASSALVGEIKMCEPQILMAYAKRFQQGVVQKIVVRRS